MDKNTPQVPEIVYGRKARFVLLRLKLFFFGQILKITKTPWRSIAEVNRIRKLRNSFHGNSRITKFAKTEKGYLWTADYPCFPSGKLKKLIHAELLQYSKNKKTNSFPQQTLVWGITNRCPLSCSHCYDWNNIDDKDHLTLKQLKQILVKIEQQGIRHVQISGGEPLARYNDLISILKEASKQIDFWLVTSGFGLNKEKAVTLKEAGLVGANISLDHWDKEGHNNFRNNPKSFAWVEQAVENCRNAGILVNLSLCATREFVTEENMEAYGKLAKNLGAHFIRVLEPRQVGKFAGKRVSLNKSQVEILSDFAIRLNNHPSYKDYPIVVFYGFHQRKIGCVGAGKRYLYIDSNGEFHACPFCQGSVGNALTDSFDESIMRLREKGCQVFKSR